MGSLAADYPLLYLQRFYPTSDFSPEPVNISIFTLAVEALGTSRNLAMSQELSILTR
jgi:hypothetical protein